MEKILEIGREDDTWVVRLRLPRAMPEPAKEHFRTACQEFVEGWRSLIRGEKKEKGLTKVEIQ